MARVSSADKDREYLKSLGFEVNLVYQIRHQNGMIFWTGSANSLRQSITDVARRMRKMESRMIEIHQLNKPSTGD